MNETWRTALTLSGTVIGAGVLGLPYVIAKVGVVLGFFLILLVWLFMTAVSLMVAEVSLNTHEKLQLNGLTKKYLGKTAESLMFATVCLGVYGALVAYIIGFGEVLSSVFGLSQLSAQLLFFVPVSIVVLFGVRVMEKIESYLVSLSVLLLLLLSIALIQSVNLGNLSGVDYGNMLVPIGALLFAFAGVIAIPNMKEGMRNPKNLKKAILIGMSIPFVLYIFFTFVVIGTLGIDVGEVATIGLGEKFGGIVLILGYLFTAVAMTTPSISLGESLKNSYIEDFRMNKFLGWFMVCFPPLILVIFNITSFLEIITIVGVFSIGVSALLEILIYWKLKNYLDLWIISTLLFVFSLAICGIFVLVNG